MSHNLTPEQEKARGELMAHLRAENEALRGELGRAKSTIERYEDLQREAVAALAVLDDPRVQKLISERDAERARADALAARVEMMKQVSDEMLYQFSEPTFPGTECRQSGHVRLSTITAWRAFLNSTPAADLEAHDARVRREALEEVVRLLDGPPIPCDHECVAGRCWVCASAERDARVRREVLEEEAAKRCQWSPYDGGEATWETSCGKHWAFEDRRNEPGDGSCDFCPFCGLRITTAILGPDSQPNEQEAK